MAEVDSSPTPPDNLSVFVDTNLDTHFAMLLSSDDTVADLKGKIKTEHALCFPKIGEVSVNAMKVRCRASFYHLSDSMPVKSAFSGVKGAWFLYLDLVPTPPIVKTQIETAGVKMSRSVGQTLKQDVLQTTGCDASLLPVSGDDMNQDVALNGLPTEKSLIKISFSNVLENNSLPDTLLEKSLAGRSSSLPSIGRSQIHKDVASSHDEFVSGSESVNRKIVQNELNFIHGVSPSGYNRTTNSGVQHMDLVSEGDGAVGSHHQQKNRQVPYQGNKDRKGTNHGNIDGGAEIDLEVPAKSSCNPGKAEIDKDTLGKNDGSSQKPVNEENFDEESGTGHDKVKLSDKAMTDADLGNKKNATNSGTASNIGIKNPQKRSKKRRETELHNTRSITQETDHSSRDQAHTENQHKMSSMHEHPGKESKEEAIILDAAATGHSAVMESASLSSPTEGKQKHKRKKTEKVQPYHQVSNLQCNMHVTVNSLKYEVIEEFSRAISSSFQPTGHSAVMESASLSSPTEGKQTLKRKKTEKVKPYHQVSNLQSNRHVTVNSLKDKVLEEFSRAISDGHLGHPGNIPKQAAIDNSTASQCVFLSDPTDKKRTCRRKKTEKIKLPSWPPIVAESVYSLVDKGNKKSLKDNKNEESGSQLGHPGKKPEVAAVSLNPSNKKSKHSRKKLGRTELPGKEAAIRKAGGKLNGSISGMGEKSKLETMLTEVAGLLVNFHDVST